MSIEVLNISRRFQQFTALDNVSLKVETGELVSLLGPSGSGKTTLLRIIAGLERADSGHVLLHGVESTGIPVRKRNVGFVFQHYALFKHMTVFDNVAFGLTARPRRTRPTKAQIREKVSELLQLMQLEGLAQRLPQQLSGGQRQRVALARALAIDPKVLLLDEPFGALDAQVRKELRHWLRELHKTLHVTSVFVTHDQEEALEVASRVVVMNHARIEQIGTPQQVYDEPANAFVCEFLGNVNVIATSPLAAQSASTKDLRTIYARPHDVEIFANHEVRESGARSAIVENIHAAGATAKVELRIFGNEKLLHAEISRAQEQALQLTPGAAVSVVFRKTLEFPETSESL